MSTDVPTPDPHPAADPDVYDDNLRLRRAIDDLTVERDFARTELKSIYDTCKQIERERDQIIADLPARDARIRAEVAEQIRAARERGVPEPPPNLRAATRRELDVYRTGQVAGLRIAECLATAPTEISAAGSAVPAEGSGHPQPATTAAGRLREIASDPQRCREWLRSHGLGDAGPGAVLLAAAADLAEGDTDV